MAPSSQDSRHDINAPDPGPSSDIPSLEAPLPETEILDDLAAVSQLDAWLRAARPDDDRITGEADAARRLAGFCGGLPLPLLITAALLRIDPTLSVSDFADELSVVRQRQQKLWGDEPWPHLVGAVAVFEMAYLKMPESAARLFRLMSVHPGPDASVTTLELLVGQPARDVQSGLAAIARVHLVEAVHAGAGRWRLRDPIRRYARQLSDEHAQADGREQALDRVLTYYLGMTEAADGQIRWPPDSAVHSAFASRADALAWLGAERLSLIAAVEIAVDFGRDHLAASLSLFLAEYLAQQRLVHELLATTIIGLSAAVRLEDRDFQGSALTNLGLVQQELGRSEEAIGTHGEAVALFREVGDSDGAGDALNNLGLALREQERFEDAIAAHQEAVAIYRETGNLHAEAAAVNNLGIVFKRMRYLDEAITSHEGAAAIYRDMEDRHGEGKALGNLAGALRASGRSSEAASALRRAASIFGEIGDDHNRGIALNSLGSVLLEAGRSVDAVSAYRQAAYAFRSISDREREDMALASLAAAVS
jgi:tetratricopeptide (TPR) repeat protein